MNKKMSIKEKIAYLEELEHALNFLDESLGCALQNRAMYEERAKENQDQWEWDRVAEFQNKINALEELIEDMKELSK